MMRKLYITLMALGMATGLIAQAQDSLLRRQMELDRDFNPTLFDANKITTLPTLHQPTVQKANTNYSTWAGRANPPLEIALPRPGEIMTAIPFSTKKGYLSFHAGNYANLDGIFGYRIIDDKRHSLAFNFLHNSTNGDLNFVQESIPAGNKAYFMDNTGQLRYRHTADAFSLDMRLSYLHSMFNYYGNSFGEDRHYNNENQRVGVMNARVALEHAASYALNLKGVLDFKNFSTKFGETIGMPGLNGNQIHALAGVSKPFQNDNNKVGVDGSIYTTLYKGDPDNYFHLNAAPYLFLSGLNWHARLGADVLFKNMDGIQVRVVPNVEGQLGITDHSSLYANVHGGYDPNTFLNMMEESRFILPFGNVRPAFTHIDLEAGAKIGEVSGFRFDFFGGFRKTDDAHFLLLNNGRSASDETAPFIEALSPAYAVLSHSFIGGMINANFLPPLTVSMRVKKNFYNVTDLTIDGQALSDAKAYNKPGVEIDLRGTFEVTQEWKFTLGYYFAGGRWSYFNREEVSMDAINDLNLGAVYSFSDAFALNLKANNLLFQKYDIWYGHPAQGFNASGGFTFTF